MAHETLKRYDLGALSRIGSVYRPSQSVGIAIETDRGRYRLWRYQPWMTEEIVELQHAMLRHLHEKAVPVKQLIAADGETQCFVDNHFVAMFDWFVGSQPGASPNCWSRDYLTALGDLHGRWAAAMADFDPPIDDWRELGSSWRPRKDWALALPCYDLPDVPARMALFEAARKATNVPAHHDEFLRGIDDTEARLRRFADHVEATGMKDLPHGMNHGVLLLGAQDFDLVVTDADDYVYEPRIGDLARLIHVIVRDRAPSGRSADSDVKVVLDAFQRHVTLPEAELRALPWVALSLDLFYRVFHVLLYLAEIGWGGPRSAAYLSVNQDREIAILDEMEGDIEVLTETLLGCSPA